MTFYETAQTLLGEQIAAIPCRADKVAAVKWRDYETRLPTPAELVDWFELETPAAIALIGGKVQCLDFDEKYSAGIFYRFKARADETGLGGVVAELLRQKTPSGGYHLVWQCAGPRIRNVKLASKANNEALIETRGEGGYFLISPSPGYTLEAGTFADIPRISADDRDALLDLARTFDEREAPPEAGPAAPPAAPDAAMSPADHYDRDADVPALLMAHGWRRAGRSDKYWTRPGKARGVSATWNVIPGRFYVFSSSTNLEQGHTYRPAWLYAALECGGDFAKAAGELRRQGFGGQRAKTPAKSLSEYIDAAEEPREMELGPSEEPSEIEGIDPSGSAPTVETEDERIRRLLKAREFDPTKQPPPTVPIFEVAIGKDADGGTIWTMISTPANLTAIIAPPKVGKTSFSSAMMAATITNETEADTLGVRGFNAEKKAVLFVDTEQAPDDFWHGIDRTRRRARLITPTEIPPWIKAYTVADLAAPISRRAIELKMADLQEEFGGIHSVFIDGVADLVLDVNDAAECNALVASLHELAIRYRCAIVCILHLNPGTDKARGHLGSQIERKAESNLKIEKDGSISVVWSNKQRRTPIEKTNGPRFAWSNEAKMHVTVAGDDTGLTMKQQEKVVEYYDLAASVFADRPSMKWSELYAALQEARKTPDGIPSKNTVERWIKAMKAKNVIQVFHGNYRLTVPPTPTDTENGGEG
jgi:hypothetical protein